MTNETIAAPEQTSKPADGGSALNAGLAPKLRLFVWTRFSPDYTSGLAFAIAEDETDARKQIVEQRGFDVYTWGDLKIYPLTRIARCVSGGG